MIAALLPFWKPIAAVIGCILLLVAMLAFKHHYDEGKRDEGRHEIQAQWNADTAMRIKRATDQTNLWDAERQKREKAEGERDAALKQRTEVATQAVASLPAAVVSVRVPAAAVRVFNDAIDASNRAASAGPASGPAKAPAADAASTNDSNVGLLTTWGTQCVALYDEARGMVEGWQDWYKSLQAAQLPAKD